MSSAFTFANGLRLFEADLLPAQAERYRQLDTSRNPAASADEGGLRLSGRQ
jgi:hypothetical protein